MLLKSLIVFFVALQTFCFGQYYSQCGQDKYVHEKYFLGKEGGIFVDIGANDGLTFSNTFFFETELKWSGICIEPIPETFNALKNIRDCVCIQGCIGPKNEQLKFLCIKGPLEMLSGIIDKYDPKHIQRIQNELAVAGGSYEVIDVNCYTLNRILKLNNIAHVDFLSIDTEGGELEILQSIDFKKIRIDVITVENNYNDARFIPFMESKGYYFDRSLEQDLIFVHKKFKKK